MFKLFLHIHIQNILNAIGQLCAFVVSTITSIILWFWNLVLLFLRTVGQIAKGIFEIFRWVSFWIVCALVGFGVGVALDQTLNPEVELLPQQKVIEWPARTTPDSLFQRHDPFKPHNDLFERPKPKYNDLFKSDDLFRPKPKSDFQFDYDWPFKHDDLFKRPPKPKYNDLFKRPNNNLFKRPNNDLFKHDDLFDPENPRYK